MIVAMQGTEVAAGAGTVLNILAGERYERSPFKAAIGQFFATGSIAAITTELNVGGSSITPPVVISSSNRIPLIPDDLMIPGWEVLEGKLIQITAVFPGAGTLFWKVTLEEAELEVV